MPTIPSPPNLLVCNHCGHRWTAPRRIERRSGIRLPWPACPQCSVQDQTVLCGGKTKDGGLCELKPWHGHDGGRCRERHRGNAAAGVAHRGFRPDAKQSNSNRYRYRYAIAKAMQDPELLSARPIVATLTARVQELRERVEASEGESSSAWRTARAAGDRLEAALRAPTPNPDRIAKELDALLGVLRAGDTVEQQWAEYAKTAEWWRRAGAYEVERHRVQAGMLPVEVVFSLMALMTEKAREQLGDEASAALGKALMPLVAHRVPPLGPPGTGTEGEPN